MTEKRTIAASLRLRPEEQLDVAFLIDRLGMNFSDVARLGFRLMADAVERAHYVATVEGDDKPTLDRITDAISAAMAAEFSVQPCKRNELEKMA